jgi:glycerophosphoryl diester phosphodiesterase
MTASTGSPPLPAGFLDRPFAHRGLHDRSARRPENSRAAIMAAIEAGYGIELDLQLSADDIAMVFHDAALDRLTDETGPVRARTAAELARIVLKGSDESVPTLAEILRLVDGRAPLLVELKDQSGDLTTSDGRLQQATAAALADHDGPVALMSFSPAIVARLQDAIPDRPRGRVTCAFDAENWPGLPEARRAALAQMEGLGAAGEAFVSHQWSALEDPVIARIKTAGFKVLCWTVRSPSEEHQAYAGADAITFEGYLPA